MNNLLELKDVTKYYDGFTLDHVSFTLPSGCIMGFIGENGAGKSTTIKLILDLIRCDEGEISILGNKNRDELIRLKEELGVVLDESCFPEILNARSVGKMMKNIYKHWNTEEYERLIHQFSLPPEKKIKEYSRGMKTKLSIAVALSHNARLLIMDEATSGLDPVIRDEILDVFFEFIQDERNSIFLSSHIISDLEKVCDYITLIHRGKILLCEQKDVLLEKYCVLKCSEDELKSLDRTLVKGIRRNQFGVEALVLRDRIPSSMVTDPASLEEIMLFLVKGRVR